MQLNADDEWKDEDITECILNDFINIKFGNKTKL